MKGEGGKGGVPKNQNELGLRRRFQLEGLEKVSDPSTRGPIIKRRSGRGLGENAWGRKGLREETSYYQSVDHPVGGPCMLKGVK